MSKNKKRNEKIAVMSGYEATKALIHHANAYCVGHGMWASKQDKLRKQQRKEKQNKFKEVM